MREEMTSYSRIAIVGGGPGGLLLARLLQLRGLEATVFERDAHADERPQGGSLDLHAGTGQRAMRLAELEAEFSAAARPEDQGDRLYDQSGTLLFDRDGSGDDRPEIDRSALRQILLDALKPGVVRWNSKVDQIVPAACGGHHLSVAGGRETYDLVVGADGAWSRVRALLTNAVPRYEGVSLVEFGLDARRHTGVATLVGNGKMFAAGDGRLLIGQRNGHDHIRAYAGLRLPEEVGAAWARWPEQQVRAALRRAFEGWAQALTYIIDQGAFHAVRPLYALPIGLRWQSRPGLTLLGDAAHLMSPFSGEGVNLALADAVDLADAIATGGGWPAIEAYEAAIRERAIPAAEGASEGLTTSFAPNATAAILEHYRERAQP
jgi:2-polyprenyl-6-methoxyphenol hydroxylase-like FAD-dependent oxidoreductase